MELKPNERAVLGQIRVLFLEASERAHHLRALTSRWPVLHYEAYRGGYAGLIKNGLIAGSADGQGFSITNAGFKAIAVTPRAAAIGRRQVHSDAEKAASIGSALASTPAEARANTLNGVRAALNARAIGRCAAFFSKLLKLT